MTAPQADAKARQRAAYKAAMASKSRTERNAWRKEQGEILSGVLLNTLRVKVRGDDVLSALGRKRLGSLTGATAEVTDGARVHRVAGAAAGAVLLGPVGLLAGLSTKRKATAFVVFADGTYHERKLDGNAAVRKAQAECVRFNLLASALANDQETPA